MTQASLPVCTRERLSIISRDKYQQLHEILIEWCNLDKAATSRPSPASLWLESRMPWLACEMRYHSIVSLSPQVMWINCKRKNCGPEWLVVEASSLSHLLNICMAPFRQYEISTHTWDNKLSKTKLIHSLSPRHWKKDKYYLTQCSTLPKLPRGIWTKGRAE